MSVEELELESNITRVLNLSSPILRTFALSSEHTASLNLSSEIIRELALTSIVELEDI